VSARPDQVSRSLRGYTWAMIGLGVTVCLACVLFLEWQWGRVMAGEQLVNEFYQSSELLASNAVRELYHMQQGEERPGEMDGALPYSAHTALYRVADAMQRLRVTQDRFGGWATEQALARAELAHQQLQAQLGEVSTLPKSPEVWRGVDRLRTRLVQLERLHAAQMVALTEGLARDQARRPQWLALFLILVPGAGLLVTWRILTLISRTVGRQAESEAALAEAQHIAGLGQWEWFPHTRTISGSGQTWEILGLPATDDPVPDRLQDERLHPDDRMRVREMSRAALEDGQPYAIQYRVVRPDGGVRWVYGRAEVVRGLNGTPPRMVGTLLDVTALKVSEMRLAESQALLLAINSSQSRYIEDGDTSTLFTQLLGDLLHLTDSAYGFIAEVETGEDGAPCMRARAISNLAWSPETRRMVEEAGEDGLVFSNLDTLFGGVIRNREVVLSNDPPSDPRSGGLPDGHPPLNAFLGVPLFASGELVGMIGIANRPGGYAREQVAFLEPFLATCGNLMHVIREHRLRQRAEAALTESERRFMVMFEHAPIGMGLVDGEGRVVTANRALCEMLGYTARELAKLPFSAYTHPDDVAPSLALAEAIKSGSRSRDSLEKRYLRKDGTTMWGRVSLTPFPAGDDARMTICAVENIDVRRRMEQDLRESEENFRAMAENIREVFWVGTPDSSRLLYVSPAFEEIFCQPVAELYQDPLAFLKRVHPDDLERVSAAMADLPRGINETYRVLRPDATVRWVQARSFPVHGDDGVLRRVVGIAIDITEGREAEASERRHQAELARVARLTTLGEVASGMAHELNQPLFAITNYARGSARMLANGSAAKDLHDTLEKIAVQAERASEVIDHLRDLARGEGIRMNPERLNDVVSTAVRLAVGDSQQVAPVRMTLAEDLPLVAADRVQLEQVVINLVRNGIEALPKGSGGVVTICTALGTDGHPRVTVTDTGTGIEAVARNELFEPFFTTKAGGMGMGLAISRTIIQAHRGQIWGRNNTQGAEFGFSLPVLGAQDDGE